MPNSKRAPSKPSMNNFPHTAGKFTFTLTPLYLLFFVTLLVLKLANVIGWSWWAVTAPLWAPILVYILAIFGFLAVLVAIFLVFVVAIFFADYQQMKEFQQKKTRF